MFSHLGAYLSPLGAGQTPDALACGYLGAPWLGGIQVSGVDMEPKEGIELGIRKGQERVLGAGSRPAAGAFLWGREGRCLVWKNGPSTRGRAPVYHHGFLRSEAKGQEGEVSHVSSLCAPPAL